MKCAKCKKKIDDDDIFCGYCGIHQEKFIKYLEKVDKKIHKDRDRDYNNKVKQAQNKLSQLEKAKQNEINRIVQSRWRSIGNSFSYNLTEGIVSINGTSYYFTDIKGAEVTRNEGFRTVTNTTGTNNQKSKKHASLGGAVAGGLILGPVGAVVGGSALGKTTTKGQNNQVTTSDNIPTCHHIGVNVNIKGFNTEIVILSKTVDQSSSIYNTSINTAQRIVDQLRVLSSTPVPKTFLKPEEEQTVLNYNTQIENAAKELQETIKDKPTYEIPESYFK